MKTHFVKDSGNGKLGKISATYRTHDTCPDSCPFKGNMRPELASLYAAMVLMGITVQWPAGCYAAGRIFASPERYGTADIVAVADQAIREVRPNGYLRFEVSGDVVNPDGSIDHAWITQTNRIATERPDVHIIRYTHAWRELDPSMFAYPVNASCETESDVAEARAAGWQTTIVGDPDELVGQSWGDSRIVQCPNQTMGVQCADCHLCAKPRTTTVLFAPHGSGKRKASDAASRRRDLAVTTR